MSNGVGHVNKLSAALTMLKDYYLSGDLNRISVQIPSVNPGTESTPGEHIEMIDTDVTRNIVNNITNIIIDNTEGAYFTKDMLKDTFLFSKFSSHAAVTSDILKNLPGSDTLATNGQEGVEKFVKILFDPEISCENSEKAKDLNFFVGDAMPPHLAPSADALGDDATSSSIKLLIKSRLNPSTPTVMKTGFSVNENLDEPDRYLSPSLSAFMLPNLRIAPQCRSAEAISIFCNSIPPIEMSRCVPLIKVQFASAMPPTQENRKRQLSLLNFLGLNAQSAPGKPPEKQEGIGFEEALPMGIKQETGLDLAFLYEEGTHHDVVSLSSAGMELFTSPQTLVNMNIATESPSRNPALDLLQPLMSLESLKIQISGLGQDIHANKTGTLSFVLHDRSRMSDIAPLIAADTFAQTYLHIDYGWSHPDGDDPDKNAFGALINSMRSSGIFNIISTTLNMGQDGQVRLTMSLGSRAREEIKIYPVSTGEVMPTGPMRAIIENYLAEKLRTGTSADLTSSEIREKITLSMGSTSSNSSCIPRSLFSEFQQLIAKPRLEEVVGGSTLPEASLSRLSEILNELVGDPNDPSDVGQMAEVPNSLVAEATSKIQGMLDTPDPFFPSYINPAAAVDIGWTDRESGAASNAKMAMPVSLGKILTVMIGGSLAGTGRFDEVQMLFYRFGNQAGAARDYESIANFLIDHTNLYAEMERFITAFPSMSIQGFLSMINEKFVEKNDNPNYGLATEFATSAEVTEGEQEPDLLVDDMLTRALMSIYSDGGGKPELRIPKLRILFEALPAFVKPVAEVDSGPTFLLSPEKVILRVHVFDANATPYEDEAFLLECANDSELAVRIGSTSATAQHEGSEGRIPNGAESGTFTRAIEKGIITKLSDVTSEDISMYTSNVSNIMIKKAIKASMPSLTFGLGTSAIKSMSISSTTQGSVSNVMTLNAITSEPRPGESEAQSVPMEDVMVIPASMTVNLFGCPLFEYGQQFFVDCGTGTTIDNIYGVTGLSHTLSPGSFDTSISLGFVGSGTVRNFRTLLTAAIKRVDEIAHEEAAAVAGTQSQAAGATTNT